MCIRDREQAARPAAPAEQPAKQPEAPAAQQSGPDTGETNGRSRRRKVSRPAGSAGTPAEPVVLAVEKPAEPATNGVPEVPAPATASVTRRPRRRAASRAAGAPVNSPEAVPGDAADATAGANSES